MKTPEEIADIFIAKVPEPENEKQLTAGLKYLTETYLRAGKVDIPDEEVDKMSSKEQIEVLTNHFDKLDKNWNKMVEIVHDHYKEKVLIDDGFTAMLKKYFPSYYLVHLTHKLIQKMQS